MEQNSEVEGKSQIFISRQGKVYVKLPEPGFQGRRCIGWLEGNSFHTERDPERHLLRTLGAFGFNFEFVRSGDFERVIVHTPNGVLNTTRQTILDFGKLLYFKNRGFERQIFLRVKDFGNGPKILPPVVTPQLVLFGEIA